jgi:hypothetical protein
MIVVDENLHDQRIMRAISAWYPGQVVSVTTLRPRTVIKDEAIPALLLKVVQPTFDNQCRRLLEKSSTP